MMIRVCTILVLLIFEFGSLEACNGYIYKLNYLKNCNPKSIIKVSPNGFNVALDNDCNIIMNGCVNVTKAFKTAEGSYSIKKPPMPTLEGDLNFCDVVESTDIEVVKHFFGVMGVSKCPVAAKNVCTPVNSKISIAQFKNQLGMGIGTATITLDVDHDTGKSCVEFSGTLSKPKKG